MCVTGNCVVYFNHVNAGWCLKRTESFSGTRMVLLARQLSQVGNSLSWSSGHVGWVSLPFCAMSSASEEVGGPKTTYRHHGGNIFKGTDANAYSRVPCKMSLRLFLKLSTRPFGYFMLDLHPASDDRFRIWSHLTKREGRPLLHMFDEDIKRQSIRASCSSKWKSTTRYHQKAQTRSGKTQRRSIAHFLAEAIPALVVGGKDAAMGGLGAAANYGTMKALKSLEKKKYKRTRRPKATWRGVWQDKATF